MPPEANVAHLAKYPFLPEARRFVARSGQTLADLLEEPAFARSRARAMERVQQALARATVPEARLDSSAGAEVELFSWPLARAVVVQLGDRYLTSRYVGAEARLVRSRLKEESTPTLRAVAAEAGVPMEDAEDPAVFVRTHFLDYLRHAPTRDPEWKLVNQTLDRGYVGLRKDQAVRLVEEALRFRLAEEIDEMPKPGRGLDRAFGAELKAVGRQLAEHHARYRDEEVLEVRLESFPPCMREIWDGIKAHRNVPHMGRFAIVSFLHKLGMDAEKVLEFFSAVPDFDASKSRYQIEHITGRIGGSTEYTPPSCQTMATYGICPLDRRDEICFTITHPLTYYRRRYRRDTAGAAAPSQTPAGGAAHG